MRLESNLDHLYSTRFDADDRRRKLALWRVLCDRFFSRYIPDTSTVIDIGAGYCEFINSIRAARRIAVDLNPDAKRFAAEGVEVHCAAIQDLPQIFPAQSVDVVFASNVFEHLRSPEALLEVLSAIRKVLKPNGRLLIMQPNIRHVRGRFWDFVDHTLPLTEVGMSEALAFTGFRVLERRSKFLPYTTKTRLPQWPWLVGAYLAFRPAHWLLGKQMFIVAQPAGQ